MKINPKDFQAPVGKKVNLKSWPTRVKDYYDSKVSYQEILTSHKKNLDALQRMLYAHNRYSLLLIFQGMDASGKDGAIRHVMSGVDPQGCSVFSFKQPSTEELDHDFLWRTTCRLPERGRIGIFNRSYYEEVVVTRVHPELLEKQNLPKELLHKTKIWAERYHSIIDFENHLHRNGTQVIKFFLHLSQQEQTQRLLSRLEEPDKNWKLNLGDIEERKFWKNYMQAYENCLGATSTKNNPWYIIPADDKENARLIISQVILSVLKNLKMHYPTLTKAHKQELAVIAKLLK